MYDEAFLGVSWLLLDTVGEAELVPKPGGGPRAFAVAYDLDVGELRCLKEVEHPGEPGPIARPPTIGARFRIVLEPLPGDRGEPSTYVVRNLAQVDATMAARNYGHGPLRF